MQSRFLLFVCSAFLFLSAFVTNAQQTREVDGKKFWVHIVEAGQTAFSISKTYDVPISDIEKYNPDFSKVIKVGQEVLIPKGNQVVSNSQSTNRKIHTVKKGETLFSISRQYDITVNEIKTWNGLNENAIDLGQKLFVSPNGRSQATNANSEENTTPKAAIKGTHEVVAGETLYRISKQYGVEVDDLVKWNNLTDNAVSIGQVLVVTSPDGSKPVKQTQESNTQTTNNNTATASTKTEPQTEREVFTVPAIDVQNPEIKKVVEKGVAEVIEGTDKNEKYLGLHKTAPVGTLLEVINEENKRRVFVRVIGKLPENTNVDVILRMSERAYQRLGASNKKIRVQISYFPY
ncbi:LysM peptidoglycan-binding domain-containing protein [Marinigracilibium pacificum]|uniref:LysM peptidoglycan-binding domain-containing protein n=1 Tax=Marinigracilibium pacificum TaxID=2729599 RepID=A0A848J7Z2_9BACT|nr:LysM peptidoglycan-binding domain-containing protein [Marinigracilibium pacificum]NMM50544.1 LysM peptidoglycan-binding domain-containing protein [Marinigracilibium pacificum]